MKDKKKYDLNHRWVQFGFLLFLFVATTVISVDAAPNTMQIPLPKFGVDVGVAETGQEVVSSLQMLFIVTIIALAPSILMMMTSFTRIIIVLHFLRSALGTQQTPPNQVLIGLALFLSFFIMAPVFTQANTQALKPYAAEEISQEEAMELGMAPFRDFMFRQVDEKDLALFMQIGKIESVSTKEEIPSTVLIPAFIISELKTAFQIGFLIYIPFIVIDMVVASTLMAMGMMMLPPVMISLPFKILLFIMVDGWNLVVGELIKTFR